MKLKPVLTLAQKWARERNTTKGQLMALSSLSRIVSEKDSTLPEERKTLQAIIVVLGKMLHDFKENEQLSKVKYLSKRKQRIG